MPGIGTTLNLGEDQRRACKLLKKENHFVAKKKDIYEDRKRALDSHTRTLAVVDSAAIGLA